MWHLRQRIGRDKIISQKWNKNETDNKAFLHSIVWRSIIKSLVPYSATNFQLNYFSFSRNACSECMIRLSLYLSKPQIHQIILRWPTVICRLGIICHLSIVAHFPSNVCLQNFVLSSSVLNHNNVIGDTQIRFHFTIILSPT